MSHDLAPGLSINTATVKQQFDLPQVAEPAHLASRRTIVYVSGRSLFPRDRGHQKRLEKSIFPSYCHTT